MVSSKTLLIFGGAVVVAKLLLSGCFFVSLAVLAGCTNLTEYDMASSGGLHIVSAEDFTTVKTIPGIEGARSLLLHSGDVFVVSVDGMVFRYDTETAELVEQSQIGTPSPAGYSDAVFSTTTNTAYVIGPLGKILELSLPECTVVDQFSVCQSPVMLATGAGSQYLFVADGPSNRIYQVNVDGNKTGGYVSIYHSIRHMASCQNPDSMLVATTNGISLVSVLSPMVLRTVQLVEKKPFVSMVAVPDDTVFVGLGRYAVGMLDVFSGVPEPLDCFTNTVSVPGAPFRVVMSADWQHAYALTYLADDNISRLISYNYCFKRVDGTLDIPGYPLDLEVMKGEFIYVLTAE